MFSWLSTVSDSDGGGNGGGSDGSSDGSGGGSDGGSGGGSGGGSSNFVYYCGTEQTLYGLIGLFLSLRADYNAFHSNAKCT